ncbi:MAG TPA: sulfite exporter TauE/SafE family protein [Bacteroidota bacterium]|nr:sulfite exporter TauE/SafE family protein [Bacteroidota bacterium]
MVQNIEFVFLGLVVGVVSGLMGVGGAVFLVPALVYLFGWQQHLAQGTTLGMLTLPIVILGAWQYYQAGNMNIKVALLLGLGVFIGGYVGGLLANQLPSTTLQRIFGVVLFLIAIKMILGK